MGRYFGGRFGDMLSPTATNPNTKAVLSLRDNYYMTRSGGLTTPVSSITDLNSRVSWTHLPNYDIYTTTNQSGNANYNGSRFRITGNIGQLEFNSYEDFTQYMKDTVIPEYQEDLNESQVKIKKSIDKIKNWPLR